MKEALTSINKPHTDNIFSGKKKIEWRKKPLPIMCHQVYETKNKGGCGKVVGTMQIVRNIYFKSVDDIPFEILNMGCVSIDYLNEYANGGEIYGNVIENPKRYKKPRELSEFYTLKKCSSCKSGYESTACIYDEDCKVPVQITRPPQSWCYVESKDTQ